MQAVIGLIPSMVALANGRMVGVLSDATKFYHQHSFSPTGEVLLPQEQNTSSTPTRQNTSAEQTEEVFGHNISAEIVLAFLFWAMLLKVLPMISLQFVYQFEIDVPQSSLRHNLRQVMMARLLSHKGGVGDVHQGKLLIEKRENGIITKKNADSNTNIVAMGEGVEPEDAEDDLDARSVKAVKTSSAGSAPFHKAPGKCQAILDTVVPRCFLLLSSEQAT